MQGQFVDAGGTRTYYLEAGKGPQHLVLMHGGGIGIDAELTWFRNIAPLAEHFHVIAFDQIGFGKTDMPVRREEFGKLLRAEHALALLDALGLERAILVGHSEGGFIASRIAVTHPERVEKLVIVASGSTAPQYGDERDLPILAASAQAYDWELEASSEEAFVEAFRRGMCFFSERMDEERLRANYREARNSGNMALYLNLPPAVADTETYYAVAREHVHPHLHRLDVETLLVWANNDPTVPVDQGRALMEMIPGAELHVLNPAKHMVMVDASEGFNRLLGRLRHT